MCVCGIAPVITISWPVLQSTLSLVGTNLGLTLLESGTMNLLQSNKSGKNLSRKNTLELVIEESEILQEQIQQKRVMEFKKDNLLLTFSVNKRNQCVLRVEGDDKSGVELKEFGRRFIEELTRQYAYHQVVTGMKEKGYTMISENIKENQSVHLVMRRFK